VKKTMSDSQNPATNEKLLCATTYFDYQHPAVEALYNELEAENPRDLAVEIYYLVRDRYIYNPYRFVDGGISMTASYCTLHNEGYCIPKASLMVALCRRAGIPARIGLADVKNHLSSPKLLALLKTDIFSMHGYAQMYINGRWLKATPAFNRSLCEKFAIEPLEFDGEHDSIFQPTTTDGQRHMEYIVDYGTFDDLPYEFIMTNFQKHYPHLLANLGTAKVNTALEQEESAQ
jgi:transglutaminase-like putative cysteine protease